VNESYKYKGFIKVEKDAVVLSQFEIFAGFTLKTHKYMIYGAPMENQYKNQTSNPPKHVSE
jgi:hypothetical protein